MGAYIIDDQEDRPGMAEAVAALSTAKAHVLQMLPDLIASLNEVTVCERVARLHAEGPGAVAEIQKSPDLWAEFQRSMGADLTQYALARGLTLLELPTVEFLADPPSLRTRARAVRTPTLKK